MRGKAHERTRKTRAALPVPLSQAQRWDENPKRHDFEALRRSIERHGGFGDPPKDDAKLVGLVCGNVVRTEVLERLRREGAKPPRGVLPLEDGEWAVRSPSASRR